MSLSFSTQCPVCHALLQFSGERYSMEQLFTLWQPVQFSEATLQEHRTQANTTGLYCCPECLLEIFLPPIIGTPQFYTEAYNLKGDQEISVVGYSTTKWDFEEAARDLGGLQRVLDVGCGPGNFLDIAVRTVPEVAGIESNPIAIDVARRNGHTIYMNLAESARTFYPVDAAFSFHLLEHVADPIDFLQDIASRVRPGGLIGISLPNQAGPIRYIQPCVQNMPPHHATRWQRRTFEKVAQRLGWRIERIAFEPLTPPSHYYYTDYLPLYLFNGPTLSHKIMRGLFAKLLSGVFFIFDACGIRRLTILKGQAMYVAFRLPAAP